MEEKESDDPTEIMSIIQENAYLKAMTTYQDLKNKGLYKGEPIIGADTLTHTKERVFMKPRSRDDAKAMFQHYLSHPISVSSAICIVYSQGEYVQGWDTSHIHMNTYDQKLQDFFVKHHYAPYSAGGFTIEGFGALFFDNIEGSFYTILGLPVFRMTSCMRDVGLYIEDYHEGKDKY